MMLLYLCYLTVFSVNLLLPRNIQDIYYTGAAIKGQLFDQLYESDQGNENDNFSNVVSVAGWYKYMEEVFVVKVWPGAMSYDKDDTYPTLSSSSRSHSSLNTPG